MRDDWNRVHNVGTSHHSAPGETNHESHAKRAAVKKQKQSTLPTTMAAHVHALKRNTAQRHASRPPLAYRSPPPGSAHTPRTQTAMRNRTPITTGSLEHKENSHSDSLSRAWGLTEVTDKQPFPAVQQQNPKRNTHSPASPGSTQRFSPHRSQHPLRVCRGRRAAG